MWFNNRQSYNRPYLAVSPDGTLIYVTDMDDRHRVVAYNLTGQPVFSFNQPDNLEQGVLGLRTPAGLAFDALGRLYVVDADQAKVFVFPPSQISGDVLPVPQSNPPVDQVVPPPEEKSNSGRGSRPLDKSAECEWRQTIRYDIKVGT